MTFLRSTDTHDVFSFDCPRCKTSGEMGIPKSEKVYFLSHECGAKVKYFPATANCRPHALIFIESLPCQGMAAAERAGDK